MFNKVAKTIRWTILLGMLYTLYSITIDNDIEFNNQKDELTLIEMARNTNKSAELFKIRRQLATLFPDNVQYEEDFNEIVKRQANKLLDAHEKMLVPVAIGNYRYIKKIDFGKDKDDKFVLVFNLTKLFDEKLDKRTQKELKKIFYITHHGIYEHYGFDKDMRLVLTPTYDDKSEIEIFDLDRVYEGDIPKVPVAPKG